MFHYVYVLESLSKEKELYIGYSTDVRQRLREHNAGKNVSTKKYRPWSAIFYEAYLEESDAKRREKYLKTSQGKRLFKRMLKDWFYKRSTHSSRTSTSRWTG